MTRSSLLTGLFGLVGVGLLGLLPLACGGGGVGDPCIPEDEYDAQFAGFALTLENIESRSFQCQTRICLVNHFQGRVSCPLGQIAPDKSRFCGKIVDGTLQAEDICGTGEACTESVPIAEDCDPSAPLCPPPGGCNKDGKFCECTADQTPPAPGYICDPKTKQFRAFICHKTQNGCQQADAASEKDNCNGSTPKDCCVPGTDIPVVTEVCGQCDKERAAENAVYCSCRCDVAPGQEKDPNFNFCECPTGFECSLIRPYEGLGQKELAGSYCIKTGSAYNALTSASTCTVDGVKGANCAGVQNSAGACN